MESKIASAIRLELEPVAFVWADEKPGGAMEFTPGKWGCVLFLLAAAAKGKTAAASRETFGCWGGGVGLGFGDQYKSFPGAEECFCRFPSCGNAGTEPGQSIGQGMAASGAATMAEDFLLGEHYLKSPELVRKFVASLPIMDIPARYVVMKPLRDVDLAKDNVRSVTFLADPDQLSALVVLANYDGEHNENVIIPFAAGFLPMNLPYTLSVEKAAEAIRAFRPKVVYPYHYRDADGAKADFGRLRKLVGEIGVEIRVRQ